MKAKGAKSMVDAEKYRGRLSSYHSALIAERQWGLRHSDGKIRKSKYEAGVAKTVSHSILEFFSRLGRRCRKVSKSLETSKVTGNSQG